MRSVDEVLSSPRGKELATFLHRLPNGWEEFHVRAVLETCGYCEYCGADVVSSLEALAGSRWDHIVPYGSDGENEEKGPWAGKPQEVFEHNIAVACWKCNSLKGAELGPGVKPKDLLALKREQRVDRIRPWLQERRRDARVVEEFAAVRELVEWRR